MSDFIIGADECGYGSWAGPLITCAVAVPRLWMPPQGLNDSKKMSKLQREFVYGALHRLPLFLSRVESDQIDLIGVGRALTEAHTSAIRTLLQLYPDAEVILDGNKKLPELPKVRCVPKADSLYPAVMAASIVGKVNHDFLMAEYAREYPGYGFDTNMGYNSPKHMEGLRKLGRSPIHRRSYHIKGFDQEKTGT